MFTKIPTSLPDCFLIEPQVFGDARGFFMESYSTVEFEKIGITADFVQDNHSKSKKGVLRGLHFQTRKPQAKLVRVTAGSVYDVVVDLRVDSPTFGKWEGFLLSAENKKMLFVPRGFAHGFLTLEDNTEFLYKCDDVYDSGFEGGILWDDADLGIDWEKYIVEYGIVDLEISEKDKNNNAFEEIQGQGIFLSQKEDAHKDFSGWIHLKSILHFSHKKEKKVAEGQVWWTHLGENIGIEMNGKGEAFRRPCIIYKKLNTNQFLVIPVTTKDKEGTWFVPFFHRGVKNTACLHQVRVIDMNRLHNRMGQLDNTDMIRIESGFEALYTK